MLYNLVFHFIIPVYRTTRRVRKSFREMSERMQQQGPVNGTQTGPGVAEPQKKAAPEDYIDFEEVK